MVVQGQIVSVDNEDKLVTLQAPGGKEVILHVFNQYSLAAAKPGGPLIASSTKSRVSRNWVLGNRRPHSH
jgi:hypothetical protein